MRRPSTERALLICQCSQAKDATTSPVVRPEEIRSVLDVLDQTRTFLEAGRAGKRGKIDGTSSLHPALDYYTGFQYAVDGFRNAIVDARRRGSVETLILSGGYGVVFPEERIHKYEAPLKVAYWRRHHLPQVLAELAMRLGTRRVIAFCSETTDYRKLLDLVVWPTGTEAARVSPIAGGGQGARRRVPTALGEALVAFLRSGLSLEALRTIRPQGLHLELVQLSR